jgi:lipopolysaccharide export system protein LptA
MPRRSRIFALAVVALASVLTLGLARAERADREKPVNIESDRMTADDTKKVATFEGRVILTQGSLTIHADRLVVRQDEAGFQYGVAYGKPATFRQKRDGFDQYVDGEALRVEYDGRTERIEFFDEARLRRDNGDDVRGSYISYDSKTEYFTVSSAGQTTAGKTTKPSKEDRVRAIIMPKASEPQKPAEPLKLQPSPGLRNSRPD